MDERTWNEMNEHSQALHIANRWLDFKMNALTQMVPGDPDCDACVLARQFIRTEEACRVLVTSNDELNSYIVVLRVALGALREALLEVAQRCENLGYTGMANFARAQLGRTEEVARIRSYLETCRPLTASNVGLASDAIALRAELAEVKKELDWYRDHVLANEMPE